MKRFSLKQKASCVAVALALAGLTAPLMAQTRTNQTTGCQGNTVNYNPGNGEDIVVPEGYKVERFSKIDLNFPTAIAFIGDRHNFKVLVLESGHGLPSRCNDRTDAAYGGPFSPTNPFTPDIVVLKQDGSFDSGPFAKPTGPNNGFQADGPAIDIAFEKRGEGGSEDRDDNGKKGGRLFATDSNQSIRTSGNNNSSRIVVVDISKNTVTPFITGLPTGDHPAEQLEFKDGWIYWSQGSTTNSSVVGLDNGGGANQQDIPCQDIVLSNNTFPSPFPGVRTSGYSPFGVQRPGATVRAFESATSPGMCDGSILRAKLHSKNPQDTIEPFSWGYRNPYGIRFAPDDHVLKGGLFVSENGEDERGARPTNNSPDRLQLAQQNRDGSPDYHGWPDRFGFLDSTQAVFNPQGGPGDDLCQPPNPPYPQCIPLVTAHAPAGDVPVQPVLAHPPQPITAPLALEPADVAAVGHDFAPDSFVFGVVRRGASLVSREGDFGFSKENGEPAAGHDIELVNFAREGERFRLEQSRFAFNCKDTDQYHDAAGTPGAPRCRGEYDQAFVETPALRGINRPVTAMFGPDDALYLVDYGAVRDFGQSDPRSIFHSAPENCTPANPSCRYNGPLVQIPRTGVIWRISRK
jgi:glucose/arabinose dehydrogenase